MLTFIDLFFSFRNRQIEIKDKILIGKSFHFLKFAAKVITFNDNTTAPTSNFKEKAERSV